jgi:hypothetical protein
VSVDLSDIVALTITCRDKNGDPEADSNVVFKVTPPDGIEVTVANTAISTGVYAVDYVTSQVGRHTWRATTASHGAFGDIIDVQPASSIALISLADARAQLNFGSSTVSDEELRGFIDAATAIVERITGPVVPRTVTEQVTGSDFLLGTQPVLSVTSIGRVTLVSGSLFVSGTYTVVYRAGRASIPPAISLAARVLVQHLWDTQNGRWSEQSAFAQGADEGFQTVAGFAVPNYAIELLEAYRKAPALA